MASSQAPTFVDEAGTARDVAQIYEAYHKAEVVNVKGPAEGQFLLAPEGMEATSIKRFLDEYRTEPERRKGKSVHRELASFIAHVNRFKDAGSAIFAERNASQPALVGVLDYHWAGTADETQPRFGEHRSIYEPALSEEWRSWMASNGLQMPQGDFAQFIEDRIGDVIQPGVANEDPQLANFASLVGGNFGSPSKLIEVSRGLAVNVEEKVRQAVNLSSGAIAVQYETVHGDGRGNPVEVPNLFLIAIPVFRSGALYRIPVRLRYRVNGGRLQWSYQLYRADKTFDHAFQEICSAAADQTSLPVFVGTPEA